ncbi:polysaccharide deacetylase family protein [Neorhizobium petrolearium]|uniref:polysaccharide deacetylase family protein n=1 Tax=Neorhizobium petrolearium TaxID=515361 RepID=UPI003F5CDC0E
MSARHFLPSFLIAMLAAGMLAFSSSKPARAADRTIYLTFDDGPLPGTENVHAVLRQENVPAALFMVGLHVETQPHGRKLLNDARSIPLATLGNHSYSHANSRYRNFYSDTAGVVADMQRANQVLGFKPPVPARLPGRNVFRLTRLFADDLSIDVREWQREWLDYELVGEAGFRLYGWDHEWVHSDDGKPVQSVDRLVSEIDHLFRYNRFMRPDKMILLMHDQMFQDKFDGKQNLETFIRQLKARGYRFGDLARYEE